MEVFLARMESLCEFSHPVGHPQTPGEACFTTLPVRRHQDFKDAQKVADKLIEDWNAIIADTTAESCIGCQNKTVGSFDSLIMAESKLERMYYTMWLTEFFFLVDST